MKQKQGEQLVGSMMMDDSPHTIAAWVATLFAVMIVIYIFSSSQKKKKDKSKCIPWAPRSIPILGHALKYKQNPAQFLLDTRARVGDIFQVNLAGKCIIIVCGSKFQRRIASAPESSMSARVAVANVGFEEMLGYDNVHLGTDLHKGIVKGLFTARYNDSNDSSNEGDIVHDFIETVQSALQTETTGAAKSHVNNQQHKQSKVEFMMFIRKVTLRSVIEYFIGRFFLHDWKDFNFIEEYMKFQDDLEDSTAKSAVMPRKLALPLLLWPLKRRRLKLEHIIAKRLEDSIPKLKDTMPNISNSKEEIGFWLAAIKEDYSFGEIAHFIVGLLFAGKSTLICCVHSQTNIASKEQCISILTTNGILHAFYILRSQKPCNRNISELSDAEREGNSRRTTTMHTRITTTASKSNLSAPSE